MYRVLIGKMAEHGITQKDLSKRLGISEKTLYNKMNGKSSFFWDEVKKIRDIVEPEITLEELFKSDDVKKAC